MKTNQYLPVNYRISSCLISRNSYKVVSAENEFEQSPLEEITDSIQHNRRCHFMRVYPNRSRDELWMVPFTMKRQSLYRFLDAMECAMDRKSDNVELIFPLDVVAQETNCAYLIRPINREQTRPIRVFMPESGASGWKLAQGLFHGIEKLHSMGLTSNGISREQMRVDINLQQVSIRFNETLSLMDQRENMDEVSRHMGFLSMPIATEKMCRKAGISISGKQRDIYSAAIVAFYMIMHSHPFIGSEFYRLVKNDYLLCYQNWPQYIMEPGAENNAGNQMLSRAINDQWRRTIPELKAMFNGIFLAVTHPEKKWLNDADYWNVELWQRILEKDAFQGNDNQSYEEYCFESERYHLV